MKRNKMRWVVAAYIFLTSMFLGGIANASNSVWDPSQQFLLVRGISPVEVADQNTYYVVLGNPVISPNTVIFQLLEIGIDSISTEALLYVSDLKLNFYLDFDGTTYDFWMQFVQDESGIWYVVVI